MVVRISKNVLLLLSVFILAFGVRCIYLFQLLNNPFIIPAVNNLDQFFYHSWALDISKGLVCPPVSFHAMPLYAYFLGGIYALFGPSVLVAKGIQAALGSLTAVVVFCIGKRTFSTMTGIVAAILFSLCTTSILYEGFIVGATLEALLYGLCILCVLFVCRSERILLWLLLGALFGVTALSRSSIVLFAFLFVPFSLFRSRFSARAIANRLIMICSMLIVIAPCTVHNFKTTGEFIPITAHSGINFYIGNNSESRGTFKPPKEFFANSQDIIKGARIVAEKDRGEPLSDKAVSHYWSDKARLFIRSQPIPWLRLVVRKVILFLTVYEIPDIISYSFMEEYVPLLSVFSWGVHYLVPLSLVGMIYGLYHERKSKYLFLFCLAYGSSIVLFFVNTRYKIPIIPIFAVYAAYAIVSFCSLIKNAKWKHLVIFLFVLFVSGFVTHIRLFSYDLSVAYNNVGLIYKKRGWNQRAIEQFRKGLSINPRKMGIYFNLGSLYLDLAKYDEAREILEEGTKLNPSIALLHEYLGIALFNQQQYARAEHEFMLTLQLDPSRKVKIKEYMLLVQKARETQL